MEVVLGIFVAILALIAIAYCVFKPKYAIVPVLMLFPVEQIIMGYLPDFRWKYAGVINVVVAMIAVLGVANHFFRREKIFEGMGNRVTYAVFTLVVYMLLSIFWTPSPDSAFYFLGKSWPYFCLFYLVSPLLVRSLEDMESVMMPMLISGVAVMFLMLINPSATFINDRFVIDLGYQVGYGRLSSSALSIADAGAILAIIASLYTPNRKSAPLTLLRAAGVLLGLTLALLSGSRGQVVASVAIVAVLLPFSTGTRSAVRVAGSVITVGLVLAFLYFVFNTFVISAAQTRWTGQGAAGGAEQRLDMALTLLGAYATSPLYWITGLGAAAFNEFYTFRTPLDPHWFPHNIVVECIAEYGFLGMALLGTICVATYKNCTKLVALAGDNRSRRTTAMIFSGIVIFQLIISMKQGYMLAMPQFFMFCMIVARVAKIEEDAALRALAENEELEQGEAGVDAASEPSEGEWTSPEAA